MEDVERLVAEAGLCMGQTVAVVPGQGLTK